MDKRNFASMIVKYWYLIEFLGQSDFPVQSREGRELCKKAANGEARLKQLTVYHLSLIHIYFPIYFGNLSETDIDMLFVMRTVFQMLFTVPAVILKRYTV